MEFNQTPFFGAKTRWLLTTDFLQKASTQRTRRNTKEICFRSGNPVFLDALESQRPDLNLSYAGWHSGERRQAGDAVDNPLFH